MVHYNIQVAMLVTYSIAIVVIFFGSIYLSAAYHEYQARAMLASYGIQSYSQVYLMPHTGQSMFFNTTVSYWAYTQANTIQLEYVAQTNQTAYNAIMSKWRDIENVKEQIEGWLLTFMGLITMFIAIVLIFKRITRW